MKCSWNIPSVYSATLFVALSSCPKIVFGCRASFKAPWALIRCHAARLKEIGYGNFSTFSERLWGASVIAWFFLLHHNPSTAKKQTWTIMVNGKPRGLWVCA